MSYLVTGTAGFIGSFVALELLEQGHLVTGVDVVNDYYDTRLKQARLEKLRAFDNFVEEPIDLADAKAVDRVFSDQLPQHVIHLAAQPGVRYSLANPLAYAQSNLLGFLNVLEGCRHHEVEHLVYASSSSVYGANTTMPYSVQHNVDHPLSLYAATKKSNELMAHSYSHLYGLPTTGLRFFTVYGPWGRPDMAYFLFTKAIEEGRPIRVFNNGNHKRDFTYIDDIVEGVLRVSERTPVPDGDWKSSDPNPATSAAPYRVYNIGNNRPVTLMRFIETLEECLGKKAEKEYLPAQPGDVPATYADIDSLSEEVGFRPSTSLADGLKAFVDWYRNFYGAAAP